jgi:hypothetical protein
MLWIMRTNIDVETLIYMPQRSVKHDIFGMLGIANEWACGALRLHASQ